jgi:hypothetical protein
MRFKHSWQQRRKWRLAKREQRDSVKRAAQFEANRLRVFLGQRDLSDMVTTFSGIGACDTREVTPVNGFQTFEPLGLPCVDVSIHCLCDDFQRAWFHHLIDRNQPQHLRVYHGSQLVYDMKVVIKHITSATTSSTLTKVTVEARSTGKVIHCG